MTLVNRFLQAARRVGLPVGRWPEEGSRILHLQRLVTVMSIDLVLDVGAHEGGFACQLRRDVHYKGEIISFEPAAATASVLRRVSHDDPLWNVQQIALDDSVGSATLHHYPLSSEMSSLRTPSDFGRSTWRLSESEAETVPTARLDQLPLKLDKRKGTFLKVDTQGHDLVVLAGAEGILPHVHALQMEVPVIALYSGTPLLEETLSEIKRRGFALSGIFPVAQDVRLRAVEFDIIAVRD